MRRFAVSSTIVAGLIACESPPESDPAPQADTAAAVRDASWRVHEEGIGPIHAGMTLADVARKVGGSLTASAGITSADCSYAVWAAAPRGVRVMLAGDTVTRIDVDTSGIFTEAGAQVGDTEARLDSLYAGRVRKLPHKYTDGRYFVVLAVPPGDTMFRLVFETDGSRVTTYRSGRLPMVEYVEGCS